MFDALWLWAGVIRHWFYHVHRAEPEVLMRQWSGSAIKLSRTRPDLEAPRQQTASRVRRHYHHCNCEPPERDAERSTRGSKLS